MNTKYQIISRINESELKVDNTVTELLESIKILPSIEQRYFIMKITDTYIARKNIKKADENLRELLKITPNYPFALFAFGKILIEKKTNLN